MTNLTEVEVPIFGPRKSTVVGRATIGRGDRAPHDWRRSTPAVRKSDYAAFWTSRTTSQKVRAHTQVAALIIRFATRCLVGFFFSCPTRTKISFVNARMATYKCMG